METSFSAKRLIVLALTIFTSQWVIIAITNWPLFRSALASWFVHIHAGSVAILSAYVFLALLHRPSLLQNDETHSGYRKDSRIVRNLLFVMTLGMAVGIIALTIAIIQHRSEWQDQVFRWLIARAGLTGFAAGMIAAVVYEVLAPWIDGETETASINN